MNKSEELGGTRAVGSSEGLDDARGFRASFGGAHLAEHLMSTQSDDDD